ncbi:MAG: archease [Candidatus Electryonea clarkiae]|nr:archease [Candidatus Electryonea clarkiae]MDP8286949.1 archease [Candidatus Electryonea clarkiae]
MHEAMRQACKTDSEETLYRIISLDHTADAGYRIEADSREELVTGSLRALSDLIGITRENLLNNKLETVSEIIKSNEASDIETLIAALNDWLYLVQVKNYISLDYIVNWTDNLLILECRGITIENSNTTTTEVKAVTYHNAEILPPDKENNFWRTTWIVDL